MESRLVVEFSNVTGCETDVAYSILQTTKWNLDEAHIVWNKLFADANDVENANKVDETVLSGRALRGSLTKINSLGVEDGKKLIRGISRATDNAIVVSKARSELVPDVSDNPCYKVHGYFIDTPEYTFTLPDILYHGEEFRTFLEKDLFEKSILHALESAHRLNWWADYGLCDRLWPLSTTGDGNCLLHAASLGMWGFHDRLLTLRKALHTFLRDSVCQSALYRRWRWQQNHINTQHGFTCSESEWQSEWQEIINMASTEPRRNQNGRRISSHSESDRRVAATYESLEEIHVLALAHILRRPIIIVADTMLRDMNGDAIAPIPFGGIYLPFEIDLDTCHKSPLLLAYDMAHFSALVSMERRAFQDDGNLQTLTDMSLIPLVDNKGNLLPIHFSVDPGEIFNRSDNDLDQNVINNLILTEKEKIQLLKMYLDVVELDLTGTPTSLSPSDDGEQLDEPIDSDDEESGRKLSETSTDDSVFLNGKSKASKQLHSVAKQFGSIGKSMGKKLKKNIGSITKLSKGKKVEDSYTYPSVRYISKIMCAVIHAKRHAFQEDMVENYLKFAQHRFLNELKSKNTNLYLMYTQAFDEGALKCINTNCHNLSTLITSYMCVKCFEAQKLDEIQSQNRSAVVEATQQQRLNTGNSKFYNKADSGAHEYVKTMPLVKPNNINDRTIYLAQSTFYNDTGYANDTTSDTTNNIPNNKLLLPRLNISCLNINEDINSNVCEEYVAAASNVTTATNSALKPKDNMNVERDRDTRLCLTDSCQFYGNDYSQYCSKCAAMQRAVMVEPAIAGSFIST